jgi:uncharacterized protein (DUF1330 family)
MAAYLIAEVSVHDAAAFEEYRKLVPATIAAYGGRYVVRGGASETVEGSWQPKRLIVLEFPTMARAKEWYNSADYQKILPLRTRASSTNAVFVEGVA